MEGEQKHSAKTGDILIAVQTTWCVLLICNPLKDQPTEVFYAISLHMQLSSDLSRCNQRQSQSKKQKSQNGSSSPRKPPDNNCLVIMKQPVVPHLSRVLCYETDMHVNIVVRIKTDTSHEPIGAHMLCPQALIYHSFFIFFC